MNFRSLELNPISYHKDAVFNFLLNFFLPIGHDFFLSFSYVCSSVFIVIRCVRLCLGEPGLIATFALLEYRQLELVVVLVLEEPSLHLLLSLPLLFVME